MKSYRWVTGPIVKMMCFFPDKGIPTATVEAFVVEKNDKILAFGKTGGMVYQANGSQGALPEFPANGEYPIVFSAKTKKVIPSHIKSGCPKWRIDPVFKAQTGAAYSYWNSVAVMVRLGDITQ
jgi:hypothetical protein